ncbi:MAG: hypothetical protein LKH74_05045 [Levilactobacillus sp.]|uniref:Uncharacterized protein n=1 Tax=Levilactobacillus suantsaiihabitans TaxID=2487722 RepID=A0A4Z0J8V7_9LACO|nr:MULTISPECIES: hypothetical protein [Levilactobacillus]MCH4124322.1 hypothetical protein [Levilactobacillus sp.]MCI1553272.1 hypothetical protein [Levilactobacillus sp.]MCI1598561.1 hypothetical protein [Levilactobacillus sp.]TGD17763.1 hypothetical protein EGT51_11210 [Levilactobacillus suantsaiihabitans]
MSNLKVFFEILAPLFIAILVLAGLAALIAWQLTPTAIGLGALGAGGLVTLVVAGVVADGWSRRHAASRQPSRKHGV